MLGYCSNRKVKLRKKFFNIKFLFQHIFSVFCITTLLTEPAVHCCEGEKETENRILREIL